MDVSMSVIAVGISLLFFSRLTGVREGTAIAALLAGLMTKFYKKYLKNLETGLGLGERYVAPKSSETVSSQTDSARKQNVREDSKS